MPTFNASYTECEMQPVGDFDIFNSVFKCIYFPSIVGARIGVGSAR